MTECNNLPLHQEQGNNFDGWRQTRKRLCIGIGDASTQFELERVLLVVKNSFQRYFLI